MATSTPVDVMPNTGTRTNTYKSAKCTPDATTAIWTCCATRTSYESFTYHPNTPMTVGEDDGVTDRDGVCVRVGDRVGETVVLDAEKERVGVKVPVDETSRLRDDVGVMEGVVVVVTVGDVLRVGDVDRV